MIGFFVAESSVLKQIFFILSAGLFIDLISTWLGNASILKLWCEKKKIKRRTGAVGKYGSIAIVERLIKSIKYEYTRRIMIPLRLDEMR